MRSTLGPPGKYLAADQVEHGGPATTASTRPPRMWSSQKATQDGLAMSHRLSSSDMSTETDDGEARLGREPLELILQVIWPALPGEEVQ